MHVNSEFNITSYHCMKCATSMSATKIILVCGVVYCLFWGTVQVNEHYETQCKQARVQPKASFLLLSLLDVPAKIYIYAKITKINSGNNNEYALSISPCVP